MSEIIQYGNDLYQRIAPNTIPPQLPPPVQPKKPGNKSRSGGKTIAQLKAYALNSLAVIGLIVLAFAFFKFSDFDRGALIPATYVDKMAETLKGEGLQTKYCDAADLEKTIRTLTQLKQPTTLKIIQLQANDGVTISGYLIGYKQKGGAK